MTILSLDFLIKLCLLSFTTFTIYFSDRAFLAHSPAPLPFFKDSSYIGSAYSKKSIVVLILQAYPFTLIQLSNINNLTQ